MIGPEVRDARIAAGLSQVALARLAGVPRKQVVSLETGQNVTLATMRKIVSKLPNLKSITFGGFTLQTGHDLAAVRREIYAAHAATKRLLEWIGPPPPELPENRSRRDLIDGIDPELLTALEKLIGRIIRGEEEPLADIHPSDLSPDERR
jgi:transcriptional regulator with XRE-family HTH domain